MAAHGLPRRLWRKLWPARFHGHEKYRPLFQGCGIEIGGLSQIFTARGAFPLYPFIQVQNCTYRRDTVWASTADIVAEATDLSFATDHSYDFLLSSHMLEHTANPLKALHEWHRVLKPGGALLLVLPDRTWTFDHRRPVTPMTHLLGDFERGVDESDMSHLDEILELHDLSRDPEAGDIEAFKRRCLDNVTNRCMHHHVFDETTIRACLETSGFKPLSFATVYPFHMISVSTSTGC